MSRCRHRSIECELEKLRLTPIAEGYGEKQTRYWPDAVGKSIFEKLPEIARGQNIFYQTMSWTPLNINVRVGCHVAYETSVPTAGLFVLRPRLEGKVLVMQEKLSFGIGQSAYEFQDSHGNISYRATLMPGATRSATMQLWRFHLCLTAGRY